MEIKHDHTEEGGMFYTGNPEDPTAQMVYSMRGKEKMVIEHTEVNETLEGKGIGSQLVEAAVWYARMHHIKILPLCSFAKSVFDKVEEYQDVLV